MQHSDKQKRLRIFFTGVGGQGTILASKILAGEAIARGEMVRWMADQKIESVSDIREFKELGYRFSPSHSTEDTYTFSL